MSLVHAPWVVSAVLSATNAVFSTISTTARTTTSSIATTTTIPSRSSDVSSVGVLAVIVPSVATVVGFCLGYWLQSRNERRSWRRQARLDTYMVALRCLGDVGHLAGRVMIAIDSNASPDILSQAVRRCRRAVSDFDGATVMARLTLSDEGAGYVQDALKYCAVAVVPFLERPDVEDWRMIRRELRLRIRAIESCAVSELNLRDRPSRTFNRLTGTVRERPS